MTDKGEAYMRILPSIAMLPMMVDRSLVVWANKSTVRAKTANNKHSATIIAATLALFLLSEKMRNSNKYTASMATPAPLIVTTRML